jgi:branched-chain amino acid transport system permease protein
MNIPSIRLPQNRAARITLVVLGVLLVYALPLLRPPLLTTTGSDFSGVLVSAALFALVALGLNIVVGYAGLLDLGYVGFYACGAYTTGVLTSEHWHWPFLLALPVAILVTMVTGIILGAPTLRVRGDYLAIVTMGFGEIIRLIVQNTEWLGAARGIKDIPHPPGIGPNPPGPTGGLFEIPHLNWDTFPPLIDLDHTTRFLKFGAIDPVPYYWVILTAVCVVLLADRRILGSRVGRAWEATREDEDAAELMGVPTFKFKLLAFAMGAAVGGLSGSLFASGLAGYINPGTFQLIFSMLVLAAVIVGGSGNRWGAILGGFLVIYLPERLRSVPGLSDIQDWRQFLFGVALMVLAVWRPQGLLPPRRTLRAKRMEQEIEVLEEGASA